MTKSASHKPVVVSNEKASWCRLCGRPVSREYRKNGNHVAVHYGEPTYPILNDNLEEI
jgi:hypothetical protein